MHKYLISGRYQDAVVVGPDEGLKYLKELLLFLLLYETEAFSLVEIAREHGDEEKAYYRTEYVAIRS